MRTFSHFLLGGAVLLSLGACAGKPLPPPISQTERSRGEDVAVMRVWRACRDEGLALDAKARAATTAESYRAAARHLASCETALPAGNNLAVEERIQSMAIAALDYIKGGNAKSAHEALQRALPDGDIALPSGGMALAGIRSVITPSAPSRQAPLALTAELRRWHFWLNNATVPGVPSGPFETMERVRARTLSAMLSGNASTTELTQAEQAARASDNRSTAAARIVLADTDLSFLDESAKSKHLSLAECWLERVGLSTEAILDGRLAQAVPEAVASTLSASSGTGSALVVPASGDFEQAAEMQRLLLERYGFASVAIPLDTPSADTGLAVAEFLSTPGKGSNDRRLVLAAGAACPSSAHLPRQPATNTVMVAPPCLIGMVKVPGPVRRIDVAALTATRDPETEERPSVAVVSLPSNAPAQAAAAEGLILSLLRDRQNGALTPAAFLETLRARFPASPSDYTPALHASPPSAVGKGPAVTPTSFTIVRPKVAEVVLYALPDRNGEPALRLDGAYPLQILRRSADGTMVYVRSQSGYYGWVLRTNVE